MTREQFATALDRYDIPSRGLSGPRRQGIVDAICHRADPARPLSAAGREWLGCSLAELAREVLGAQDVETRGLDLLELAGRAFNLVAVQTRRGFLTTSDFPTLLAQVGRTLLTAGYQAAERTFPPWTRQGTLPDFRPTNRVSLGLGPKLLKIAEHGEYPRGPLASGPAQPMKLDQFGRVLAFSREAMVNDDIGLFRRIPAYFAAAAAALESDVVYGILTGNPTMADGFALFSANHGNLMTAAPITVASMAAARTAMTNQKSLDGQFLSIMPRFLICGPQQEVYALQFLAPLTIVSAGTQAVPTEYRSLRLVVDPRITDAAWYLAADPNQIDTIEYDFLEGSAGGGPTLDTREGWDIDGQEFKAREEFCAAAIDYRGLVKNPGQLPA